MGKQQCITVGIE